MLGLSVSLSGEDVSSSEPQLYMFAKEVHNASIHSSLPKFFVRDYGYQLVQLKNYTCISNENLIH